MLLFLLLFLWLLSLEEEEEEKEEKEEEEEVQTNVYCPLLLSQRRKEANGARKEGERETNKAVPFV